MTLTALAAGALLGLGLLVGLRAVLDPPAPRLRRRLADLYLPPVADGLHGTSARARAVAMRAAHASTGDPAGLRQDLAVCGVTLERHAAVKATMALAGAATPVAVSAVWATAGISVSAPVVLSVALAAGTVGFVAPGGLLARRAAARRREFRHCLALYLELVVIVLAGGGGTNTALFDAADAGDGWGFDELGRALHTARLQRRSPWLALGELADRIGSSELAELAASVELAGTSGARVRESLRARAASARDHELAETEADALAASERMGGPLVGMFVGLILLIGYPAMATVVAL